MKEIDYIERYLYLKKEGKQSEINSLLRKILDKRNLIGTNITDPRKANTFVLTLIHILQIDMCKDEDEDIKVCQFAYYILGKILHSDIDIEIKIEAFRLRIILLSSFGDYLINTIISIFFSDKKYTSEEFMKQRILCEEYIKRMQLSDFFNIDDLSEGTYNDLLLIDIYNSLDYQSENKVEELKEADFIHNILYKYINKDIK